MDDGHLVFYCNDVCAAVDWELNRENINKQDTSGKGRKPLRKANYWVQSTAATKARKMLRAAVDRGELPDLDRIMHEIKVQRQLGKTRSAAIARSLPGNDEEDKDGALTSTQKAKRHIIRGAEYFEKVDSYPEPDIWHGAEPPRGTYREQIAQEKARRYLYDVREIERVVREGNNVGKGTVDKNAPSKPAPEKKVSASSSEKRSDYLIRARALGNTTYNGAATSKARSKKWRGVSSSEVIYGSIARSLQRRSCTEVSSLRSSPLLYAWKFRRQTSISRKRSLSAQSGQDART